jgi:undecaprenyl phosphate N,N'-diacetylbacillosamine 1-phosphate transferase
MEPKETLQRILMRFIDFALASILLAVSIVPLLIIAIALKIESRGPVLFKQVRAGEHGSTFTLYKLRSMKKSESVFHDEQMVTRVGRFIRKWRIDEIPQLVNVLKGEMSIVGPRPTLPYQVERYDDDQMRRLSVRPGLTGWSQIRGDSAISWPDRIALDLWYVDNWSLWLDLKIILRTPFALLKIQEINVEEGPPPDEISSVPASGTQVED